MHFDYNDYPRLSYNAKETLRYNAKQFFSSFLKLNVVQIILEHAAFLNSSPAAKIFKGIIDILADRFICVKNK